MPTVFDGGASSKVSDIMVRAATLRGASDGLEAQQAKAEQEKRDQEARDREQEALDRQARLDEQNRKQQEFENTLKVERSKMAQESGDLQKTKFEWQREDRKIEAQARAQAQAGGDADRALVVDQINKLDPSALDGVDVSAASPVALSVVLESLKDVKAREQAVEAAGGRIERMYTSGFFGPPSQTAGPDGAVVPGPAEQMAEMMRAELAVDPDNAKKVMARLVEIEEKAIEKHSAEQIREQQADGLTQQAATLQGASPTLFAQAMTAIEAYRAGEEGADFKTAWKAVGDAIEESRDPTMQIARQLGVPAGPLKKLLDAVGGGWIPSDEQIKNIVNQLRQLSGGQPGAVLAPGTKDQPAPGAKGTGDDKTAMVPVAKRAPRSLADQSLRVVGTRLQDLDSDQDKIKEATNMVLRMMRNKGINPRSMDGKAEFRRAMRQVLRAAGVEE